MICTSCRRALAHAQSKRIPSNRNPSSLLLRQLATAPSTSNAAPTTPPPSTSPPSKQPTPAISSSTPGISQPLSTPTLSSTSTAQGGSAAHTKEPKRAKPQSSIAGGTELKGLGYLKAKPSVLAKEDDEYPAWLWRLLDEAKDASGMPAVDLAAMTKKARAKYDRKQERLMKDIPKPIPVHEQARDLTGPEDSAVTSLLKRQELTKSSREARRKGIRENNFLRGM